MGKGEQVGGRGGNESNQRTTPHHTTPHAPHTLITHTNATTYYCCARRAQHDRPVGTGFQAHLGGVGSGDGVNEARGVPPAQTLDASRVHQHHLPALILPGDAHRVPRGAGTDGKPHNHNHKHTHHTISTPSRQKTAPGWVHGLGAWTYTLLVMTRGLPSRAFTKVDLPTLGRPAMARHTVLSGAPVTSNTQDRHGQD
jgi:hypothetical protein